MNKKNTRILIVEDDESALFGYKRSLQRAGYLVETETSLKAAKKKVSLSRFHAILLDLTLPDGNSLEWIPHLKKNHPNTPVVVISGMSDVPTAVKATKYGAENFLTKPAELKEIKAVLRKSLEIAALRKQQHINERLVKKQEPCFGNSEEINTLLDNAQIGAANDSILLLQGETGTGKGVLARWVHEQSARSTEAFVQLNCSSLKGELLRSELFGHAKGAFTTAVKDREGLVEVADGGSLFLDEIGDMDIDVQAQLLTAIEEKTFRRVGENRVRKSNFRLICATNKDLVTETRKGNFRKDLYYRICIFPIHLPPLRRRTEDIPILIEYFLRELGYQYIPAPRSVVHALKKYTWPGNVRELRNMLERALLLAQGARISKKHFPGIDSPIKMETGDDLISLAEVENRHIKKVLNKCHNDKKKACKILDISLSSLYRRLNTRKYASTIE